MSAKAQRFLYLSRADVERVALDMATIIALLEAAFREKGEGRVEMPPKPGIHPRPDAFLHAMAASIPGMGSAGLKWVAGFPENAARGLPYVTGLIVLNDVDTGLPLAVMDATWITAHRTGAATALSARYLARPESSVAGILACGVQGRTNLLALAAVFPLRKVYAYDHKRENRDRYVSEMTSLLGLEVEPSGQALVLAWDCASVLEAWERELAVLSWEVVTKATPSRSAATAKAAASAPSRSSQTKYPPAG